MSASKEYFKKAEQAAKKQNFDYAIELYMQGIMIDPKASEERRRMHHVMTLAIQEKGGNPQGGMSVKLKVMPILANVKKLTVQQKWDEAIIEYEKALRFQPQHSSTLFGLAKALMENDCEDSAVTILEDVVNNEKSNVEAYRSLGKLYAKRDDPEQAISYWEKVKQYKPDDKEAGKAIRDLSAATMVKKAEERKAKSGDESFKAMLKDEDESAELEKKNKIIRNDDDRREAVEFKKEELRSDPKNSRLWRDLGQLYQELQQWKYALAAYKKASEVNPHDLFAQEKIGTLREEQYLSKIEALRKKVESSNGNSGKVTEQLEEAEAKFRQFKVDEYERRVKAHPTDYELKMRYGHALMEVTSYDEAIQQFQKAVQDPKFKIKALSDIGTCFLKKELEDLAAKQFQSALGDISDGNSDTAKEIKYKLGICYEQKADKISDEGAKKTLVEQALTVYQEIMAVDIGYLDVSDRVSRLMT